MTLAELEAMPRVGVAELELHHVYVIQSDKWISTWNYEGSVHALHPVTLDTVVAHKFWGPRVSIGFLLEARPDGTFADIAGTRIVIRRYPEEAIEVSRSDA